MAVTRRTFLSGTAATAAAGALYTGLSARSSALADDAPSSSANFADRTLARALARLVRHPDGPPGALALIQRGGHKVLYRAGTADLASKVPIRATDSMRCWTWASGGIVATPADANTFIRAYVRGASTSHAIRRAQFEFRSGSSEPIGPGRNSVGLAIFRYQTGHGTVYGHTGNTAGYTQFVAASGDGKRSMVVSVNSQITPTMHPQRFTELRQIYTLAVCAALAHD